jgi:hypothetical protein
MPVSIIPYAHRADGIICHVFRLPRQRQEKRLKFHIISAFALIITTNGKKSNANGKISKQIDIFPFAERWSLQFFCFTRRGLCGAEAAVAESDYQA